MATFSFKERQALEEALRMSSGYVLDFTDKTFQEFIQDCISVDVNDQRYKKDGSSKAKRLRCLFDIEPDHVVGKLLRALIEQWTDTNEDFDPNLLEFCRSITERLCRAAPVLDGMTIDRSEGTLEALTRSIRQSIENNQPEVGIDRLHTYFVSFMRKTCAQNNISTSRDEPAHSVLGKYTKALKASGRVESEMTIRILTYANSTLDAFNRVRNEQSLAHPNPILNYHESLLIFTHIVSVITFINSIEQKHSSSIEANESPHDQFPF